MHDQSIVDTRSQRVVILVLSKTSRDIPNLGNDTYFTYLVTDRTLSLPNIFYKKMIHDVVRRVVDINGIFVHIKELKKNFTVGY